MRKELTENEIIVSILGGDVDDHLREIGYAVRERMNAVSRMAARTTRPGDRVIINAPGSKYDRKEAVVEKTNRKTVDLKLVDGGQVLRVNGSMIDNYEPAPDMPADWYEEGRTV